MTDIERLNAARRLFGKWTGVTNPELLAALWNNLCAGDRALWVKRAGEQRETPGVEAQPV